MSKELTVGTLCVTVNTNHPECNDGVLVVIIGVAPCRRSARGEPIPYLIRRVDGQPHVSTSDWRTGEPRWMHSIEAWCAGYKLKPVGDSEQQDVVVKEVEHV